MNRYKLLLLACSIAFSLNANAQKDTSTANKVTVFDNNPGTYRQQKQQPKAQTIIKINPLLFINGDIPIYFERVINPSLTVEVAPGLTYDDFVNDLWVLAGLTPLQEIDNTKAQFGYSFNADLKYFPGQNVIDGIYLSPELGYRHYSIGYPDVDNNSGNTVSNTTTYTTGHINHFDIKLLFGHEAESDWVDNLFFDWYLGIGLRASTALQYTNNDAGGNYISAPVAYNYSYVRPAFYAGFKIGIGF